MNARLLERGLDFTGGCFVSADKAEGKPNIDVRFLPADSPLIEVLDPLAPSRIWTCRGNGYTTTYFADGAMEIRDGSATTRLHLLATTQPSTAGAFGHAILRTLTQSGSLVLHAGAYSLSDLSWLAVGESGTGKSTLAAAVLAAGGKIISDDLVAVCGPSERASPPTLHAMRRDAYFSPDSAHLIPAPLSAKLQLSRTRQRPKLMLARNSAPQAFLSTKELSCIILLSAGDRQKNTTCVEVSDAEALSALIAATGTLTNIVVKDPAPFLKKAAQIVASRPAFKLTVGTSLLSDPESEMERITRIIQHAMDSRSFP